MLNLFLLQKMDSKLYMYIIDQVIKIVMIIAEPVLVSSSWA